MSPIEEQRCCMHLARLVFGARAHGRRPEYDDLAFRGHLRNARELGLVELAVDRDPRWGVWRVRVEALAFRLKKYAGEREIAKLLEAV